MNSNIQPVVHPYGPLIFTYSNRFDNGLKMENEDCPRCNAKSLIAFKVGAMVEVMCESCEKFGRAASVARALVELELN